MARDSAVGQSAKEPFRFTEIHNRLSQGVKDLIELYNLQDPHDQSFILKMKDLLSWLQGESTTMKRMKVHINMLSGRTTFGTEVTGFLPKHQSLILILQLTLSTYRSLGTSCPVYSRT